MKLRTVFETASAGTRYIVYQGESSAQPIFCGSFTDKGCYGKLRDYLNHEATDKGMSGTYHLVCLEWSAA